MDKVCIIGWIILLLAFGVILIGLSTSNIARTECKNLCAEEGALTYDLKAGGGLTKNENDICICFYKDYIRTFRLGDYND